MKLLCNISAQATSEISRLSIAASAVIPRRTKPEIIRQITSWRWYLYLYLYLLFPPLSLLVNNRAAFLPPIPTWYSCHSSNKLRGVGLRAAGAAPTSLSVVTASTAVSSSLPPVALVPPSLRHCIHGTP